MADASDNPPLNSPKTGAETGMKPSLKERIARSLYDPTPKTIEALGEVLNNAHERGLLDKNTLNTIHGALAVTEMRVRDIMIPRAQITAVEKSNTFTELLDEVTRSGHSRFPVIADDKDELIGILLAKDLLTFALQPERFSIDKVMRDVVIIPESKRLNTLLNEFRSSRQHMALVVDEYGGVSGLVTIEDVLEVIVGEIDDEHDTEEGDNIMAHHKGHYSVNALTELDEFNSHFELRLPTDEADTIGGYVMRHLGHVPKRGEKIQIAGLEFTVLSVDSRRIYRLKVAHLTDANKATASPDSDSPSV